MPGDYHPPLAPLVRRTDPATSHAAAARVKPVLSQTQALVLAAIAGAGARGLTDLELEALPLFAHLRQTTARKRRTELTAAGHVVPAGVRDHQTVWVAVASEAPVQLTTTMRPEHTR